MKCPMCGHDNAGGSLCTACGESMVERVTPKQSVGRRYLVLFLLTFGIFHIFLGPFIIFTMKGLTLGFAQLIAGVCCTIAGAFLRRNKSAKR